MVTRGPHRRQVQQECQVLDLGLAGEKGGRDKSKRRTDIMPLQSPDQGGAGSAPSYRHSAVRPPTFGVCLSPARQSLARPDPISGRSEHAGVEPVNLRLSRSVGNTTAHNKPAFLPKSSHDAAARAWGPHRTARTVQQETTEGEGDGCPTLKMRQARVGLAGSASPLPTCADCLWVRTSTKGGYKGAGATIRSSLRAAQSNVCT